MLQEMFPGKAVFSRRSVQRYCVEKSISARVKQEEVATMVARVMSEVDIFLFFSVLFSTE